MQINLLNTQSLTDSTSVTLLKAREKTQLGFIGLHFCPIINFDSNFQRGVGIDISAGSLKTHWLQNWVINCVSY